MGSSFTEFGKVGFWSRDAALEVWLLFLSREAQQVASPPPWLEAAAANWHLKATVGFTGCIHAGLDEHLTQPVRVATALSLASRAHERLRSHGPVMNRDVLNALETGGEGSCFTTDVPTEAFTRVGETFIRLLRREISWTAATSPVVS